MTRIKPAAMNLSPSFAARLRGPFAPHPEAGSSVAEFLILAPVLGLLLFATIDLNDRLERRRDLVLASRNVAASADPTPATLGAVVKRSLVDGARLAFQSPETAQRLAAVANAGASTNGGGHVLSGTAPARDAENDWGTSEADALDLKTSRVTAQPSFDGQTYQDIGKAAGIVAGASSKLDGGLDWLAIGSYRLFLYDRPHVGTARLATPDTASLPRRALRNLAKQIEPTPSKNVPLDMSQDMATRSFVRTESGRHPNDYRFAGLVGFGIGLVRPANATWGQGDGELDRGNLTIGASVQDDYAVACMMNFNAGDSCTSINWYSAVVLILAEAKGISTLFPWPHPDGSGRGFGSMTSQASSTLSTALLDAAKDQIDIEKYIGDQNPLVTSVGGTAGLPGLGGTSPDFGLPLPDLGGKIE